MAKDLQGGIESNQISRRSINKGVVWVAPVVVAAAAAPSIAASEPGALWVARVAASGISSATGNFVLPSDATDVTYTVVGGGGGGSTNGTGGSGHQITGSLEAAQFAGSTLTLTAGGGGGAFAAARPDGIPQGSQPFGGQGWGTVGKGGDVGNRPNAPQPRASRLTRPRDLLAAQVVEPVRLSLESRRSWWREEREVLDRSPQCTVSPSHEKHRGPQVEMLRVREPIRL